MSYLLDTNVLSEVARKVPNPHVLSWFASTPDELLYVSVLTLGEIRKGIDKIDDTARRERLGLWLEHDVPAWFGSRIVTVDVQVADTWGRLCASMGRPLPVIDSLLAATALHYKLRLVTRNGRDFNYPQLMVINPWELMSG